MRGFIQRTPTLGLRRPPKRRLRVEPRQIPKSDSDLPDGFVYADETCRAVAEEMATTGIINMPVVDRENGRLCGRISAQDLLAGRRRAVVRESERRR